MSDNSITGLTLRGPYAGLRPEAAAALPSPGPSRLRQGAGDLRLGLPRRAEAGRLGDARRHQRPVTSARGRRRAEPQAGHRLSITHKSVFQFKAEVDIRQPG